MPYFVDPDTGASYYVPDPPPPSTPAPSILTVSLPNGAIAAPYSAALEVSGGSGPFTYAVTAGALPANLTLSATTGVISGTPTASGNSSFVVTVTDSETPAQSGSAALLISIPSTPSILNLSIPLGAVGVPFFASLTGTGGAAPYGFRVTAGALPAGLVLAATGGITGTPTIKGTFSVTVQIYDSGAPQATSSAVFAVTIAPSSATGEITSLDQCVLLGGDDGGLYMLVPGQRHDTDIAGNPVGFLQKWQGVPTAPGKLAELQLGGATVSAKGSGVLNVAAIDGKGNIIPISSDRRQMILDPDVETTRDFLVKAAPKSERYGMIFDNGGSADAWFELHVGILYTRPFFGYRKA